MPISFSFSEVELLEPDLWVTSVSSQEVTMLGEPKAGGGASDYNIILVGSPNFDISKSTLTVDFGNTDVLYWGSTEKTLLVKKHADQLQSNVEVASEKSGVHSFERFLSDCEKFELPHALVEAAKSLLHRLDVEEPFELAEGEQRKWTAKPNFLAITIQNRNRKFLVSVKGNPRNMDFETIRPKVSRPPYCEFHFESPEQLSDVLDAARASRRN